MVRLRLRERPSRSGELSIEGNSATSRQLRSRGVRHHHRKPAYSVVLDHVECSTAKDSGVKVSAWAPRPCSMTARSLDAPVRAGTENERDAGPGRHDVRGPDRALPGRVLMDAAFGCKFFGTDIENDANGTLPLVNVLSLSEGNSFRDCVFAADASAVMSRAHVSTWALRGEPRSRAGSTRFGGPDNIYLGALLTAPRLWAACTATSGGGGYFVNVHTTSCEPRSYPRAWTGPPTRREGCRQRGPGNVVTCIGCKDASRAAGDDYGITSGRGMFR